MQATLLPLYTPPFQTTKSLITPNDEPLLLLHVQRITPQLRTPGLDSVELNLKGSIQIIKNTRDSTREGKE